MKLVNATKELALLSKTKGLSFLHKDIPGLVPDDVTEHPSWDLLEKEGSVKVLKEVPDEEVGKVGDNPAPKKDEEDEESGAGKKSQY